MYCTWKDTRGARFYICPTRQPKETLDIALYTLTLALLKNRTNHTV